MAELESNSLGPNVGSNFGGMPGDANYLRDVEAQYDWHLALTRVLSEYWRKPDGEFAEILLSGNQAKIRQLFSQELSYVLPPGLTVFFEKVKVPFSNETNMNGWAASLNALTPSVTIKLPNAPDVEFRAKAIADYVATGKAYPFT